MRTDSILAALQKKGCLDAFMQAMTNVAGETRGTVGVEFCKKLGFKTSRTAVYEGYRRYYVQWQLGFSLSTALATESGATFGAQATRVARQRFLEALSDPDLDPKILLAIARQDVRGIRIPDFLKKK